MDQHELPDLLTRKLEIITEIGANTERQSRFIRRRELRGLRRLLRERAVLLNELAAVNRELAGAGWQESGNGNDLPKLIAVKETEVLERSRAVLQEAQTEKERMGSEMKSLTTRQQLKRKYLLSRWITGKQGGRFNAKG